MSYNKPIALSSTPGPWEVSVGNKGSIFGDLDNAAHDGDNPYIGTVAGIGVGEDIPECTANAKLIAAAPELLSAFNAIIENFPKEVLKDQLNEDYELIESVIEKLK